MSEQRHRLTGWGEGDTESVWWKRGRDPIGRHTMVAVIMGVVVAAIVGALFDPLNMQTADDIRRAEEAAHAEAYVAAEPLGYRDGVPYGEVEYLGAQIVGSDDGAESPYGASFSDGWREGWNDALDAMRASAMETGLPEGYTEYRVLDEMTRR